MTFKFVRTSALVIIPNPIKRPFASAIVRLWSWYLKATTFQIDHLDYQLKINLFYYVFFFIYEALTFIYVTLIVDEF